ncbi:MAG: adenylate/guanylate cyclase domain-containing protein [Chloroflexota bacterium]|nr:adenylate/guanylate cyclase domain-containing protein [Chloroflexota bacterium]
MSSRPFIQGGTMQQDDYNASKRELQLLYYIDRLRDSTRDDNTLIGGVTSSLRSTLSAEFCMVTLKPDEGGDPVVRSLVDTWQLSSQQIEAIHRAANQIEKQQVLALPHDLGNYALMGAPLQVNGERFGAVVIGREKAFGGSDERLLMAAISQLDSGLVHMRVLRELELLKREIKLLYRIDHIRDHERDFDTMLQRVLVELCRELSSDIGFIALYNADEDSPLEIKIASEGAAIQYFHTESVNAIALRAIEQRSMLSGRTDGEGVRSYLAAPLVLGERIIGVVGALDSQNARGFGLEDEHLLNALTSQIDTAIFERKEERKLRRLLMRAVDPRVVDQMLTQTNTRLLRGQKVVLTALFADIRNSTAWAEETDADALVTMINRFYRRMTDIIFGFDGTLDKYVGDQIIALFGTPIAYPDHALMAAKTAVEMQIQFKRLQQEVATEGYTMPPMGIGLHTGMATAGEFGDENRAEFSALGPAINLCSRICDQAPGGEIWVSEQTRELLKDVYPCEALPALTIKGIPYPINAYRLHWEST